MKVSECCGASPKAIAGPHGTPDCDTEDLGICPECHEHCEYIEEEDPDDAARAELDADMERFAHRFNSR